MGFLCWACLRYFPCDKTQKLTLKETLHHCDYVISIMDYIRLTFDTCFYTGLLKPSKSMLEDNIHVDSKRRKVWIRSYLECHSFFYF